MHSDSYKIVISLSRHRISFEYWQPDGADKLMPMPDGNWPAPLAFYSSSTGIVIGEEAARAAHAGTPNAFDNYFERIAKEKDETYNIGGQSKPIRYLLLDASETIFNDFFHTVLFKRFGSLSDNRANMPLTLVCESDIRPNEKAFLKDLFKGSGYNRFRMVEYDTYIERYVREAVSKEHTCDNVLVAWTEDESLTFTLFNVMGNGTRRQATFAGLGIDPRIEYVKTMIWKDFTSQNSFLERTNEEELLCKAASEFLCSGEPMVHRTLTLSDGETYHYSLNRNSLCVGQSDEGILVKKKLDAFLQEAGITNRSRTLLLLRGVVAGNAYFEQNLCQGFSKTIRSDSQFRDNVLKMLVSESVPTVQGDNLVETDGRGGGRAPRIQPSAPEESKAMRRKWREVQAAANGKIRSGQPEIALQMLKDFYSQCEKISGVGDLLEEIKNEMGGLQPPSGLDETKQLKQAWREAKAAANGKFRSGKVDEARKILIDFSQKARNVAGCQELLAQIDELLHSYTSAPHSAPHTPNGRKGISRKGSGYATDTQGKNGNKNQAQGKIVRLKSEVRQNEGGASQGSQSGLELIRQGKLKEARDWYRDQKDNEKACILTGIIRAQKGVAERKQSVGEYKKTKNKEQISRIVKELENYLSLCDKVGFPSEEYKKLLTEYKRIK